MSTKDVQEILGLDDTPVVRLVLRAPAAQGIPELLLDRAADAAVQKKLRTFFQTCKLRKVDDEWP